MDNERGVPIADGTTKRPKHRLGRREPTTFVSASECITYNADSPEVANVFRRKIPNKSRIVVEDHNGEWIIKIREP